ncbi:MAG: hypothetical protein ABI165_07605 [Bryobacteraceae bacterium]
MAVRARTDRGPHERNFQGRFLQKRQCRSPESWHEYARSLKDAADAMAAKGLKPTPPSSSAETWSNASEASGDLWAEIARLKEQPGKDILAHGGSSFAQSLAKLGYRWVSPDGSPGSLGVWPAVVFNIVRADRF